MIIKGYIPTLDTKVKKDSIGIEITEMDKKDIPELYNYIKTERKLKITIQEEDEDDNKI